MLKQMKQSSISKSMYQNGKLRNTVKVANIRDVDSDPEIEQESFISVSNMDNIKRAQINQIINDDSNTKQGSL